MSAMPERVASRSRNLKAFSKSVWFASGKPPAGQTPLPQQQTLLGGQRGRTCATTHLLGKGTLF